MANASRPSVSKMMREYLLDNCSRRRQRPLETQDSLPDPVLMAGAVAGRVLGTTQKSERVYMELLANASRSSTPKMMKNTYSKMARDDDGGPLRLSIRFRTWS